MIEITSVKVVVASAEHVDGMARCHISCFPTQFASRMGLGYARELYAHYLRHEGGIALTALSGDKSLGVCVGGAPSAYGEFLEHAARKFAWTFFARALTDGVVCRTLLSEAWRRFGPGKVAAGSPMGDPSDAGGRWAMLQVIGVSKAARGTGIADHLIEAFHAKCQAAGYESMRLVTLTGNSRAIAFFQRHGWSISGVDGGSTHMFRSLRGPAR